MKNPKVGDRVAWYDEHGRHTGKIRHIVDDGMCDVHPGCMMVHRTHLIRLKPKAKAREWWLGRNPRNGELKVFDQPVNGDEPAAEWIRVREIRK